MLCSWLLNTKNKTNIFDFQLSVVQVVQLEEMKIEEFQYAGLHCLTNVG